MDTNNLSGIELLSLILAFWSIDLSYKNLSLNLGQTDKDDIMKKLDEQTKELLKDIHKQLDKQNKILAEQTKLLKEIKEIRR